jgi:hypothetical protein
VDDVDVVLPPWVDRREWEREQRQARQRASE